MWDLPSHPDVVDQDVMVNPTHRLVTSEFDSIHATVGKNDLRDQMGEVCASAPRTSLPICDCNAVNNVNGDVKCKTHLDTTLRAGDSLPVNYEVFFL